MVLAPDENILEPIGPEIVHPCQVYADECQKMRCPYGIDLYNEDECDKCKCRNPCENVTCPTDSICAIDFNINRTTELDFIGICRQSKNKFKLILDSCD